MLSAGHSLTLVIQRPELNVELNTAHQHEQIAMCDCSKPLSDHSMTVSYRGTMVGSPPLIDIPGPAGPSLTKAAIAR